MGRMRKGSLPTSELSHFLISSLPYSHNLTFLKRNTLMKKLLFVAMMLAAEICLAAENDMILTFSTQGPDTYGDGSTVLDGERYALVWVKDGAAFSGITADGKTLADTTKVIAVAPLAKAGKCPETVFEIDADYAETLKGGSFALYLLDTRVSKTALAKEKRLVVNATGEAAAAECHGSTVGIVKAGAVSLAKVGVYTEVAPPKIAAIKVTGSKIELKVDGMVENHAYFVVPGSSPSDFMPALATKPEGDIFTFDAQKGAPFFKVIGARMFK